MDGRISINPRVMHGQPVIAGTRIPVSLILNLLAHGYDVERVLLAYPALTAADVRAAQRYGAEHSVVEAGREPVGRAV